MVLEDATEDSDSEVDVSTSASVGLEDNSNDANDSSEIDQLVWQRVESSLNDEEIMARLFREFLEKGVPLKSVGPLIRETLLAATGIDIDAKGYKIDSATVRALALGVTQSE